LRVNEPTAPVNWGRPARLGQRAHVQRHLLGLAENRLGPAEEAEEIAAVFTETAEVAGGSLARPASSGEQRLLPHDVIEVLVAVDDPPDAAGLGSTSRSRPRIR